MPTRLSVADQGLASRLAIDAMVSASGLDFQRLNIEELRALVDQIEAELAIKFVRMDFGVPGLPPPDLAVRRQAGALLDTAVASQYPPAAGVAELKRAAARFVERTLGVAASPEDCIATCGATAGLFVAQALAGRMHPDRDTILYLEPGYPPTKAQARFLGLQTAGIDLYERRGEALIAAIRELAAGGRIAAICWSCPNNPTWLFLSEDELAAVGEICDRAGIVAIEDVAYLGVDPKGSNGTGRLLQSSIGRHASRWFLILSASKMLSYAGERVGVLVGSPALMEARCDNLIRHFGAPHVRRAVTTVVFNLTAGAPHSAQLAVAALLASIDRDEYDLVASLAAYRERARAVKRILWQNGFRLIYDADRGEELGDGFYFTFGFPGVEGPRLLRQLLGYGISTLPLSAFGSCRREGLRACVARVREADLEVLAARLRQFRSDHQQGQLTNDRSEPWREQRPSPQNLWSVE